MEQNKEIKNVSLSKPNKNTGITLIALIITVILMLILAAVAISAIMDGLTKDVSEAEFKYTMSSYSEALQVYKFNLQLKDINNYKPKEINAGEVLKSINIDEELGMKESEIANLNTIFNKVGKEKAYIIVYEGDLYYVSQKKIKNNEEQVKWCKELGIKIWDYEPPTGIKIVNGNYELVNGVYLCTPKLNMGFSKDYTRYITLRDGNMEVGTWINKKPEDDWYDYKNQKWANLYVEANGLESYYVWIPRYVYKKDTENSVTGNERMDVKFVDTDNSYIDAETGVKTKWDKLQADGYQLPEAFWWDNNGDGKNTGDEEIPGYWMSKYQLSELTTDYTVDYSTAATPTSITIQNIETNTTKTIAKYTYALNGEIVHTSTNGAEFLLKDLAKGNKAINVTALDENGEIIGSMTKVYEIADVNEPDVSAFDKDTTFYVYWDEKGNEYNHIPISMDPPAEWYDYTTANWANIVTRNDGVESYFVWIPRYQYALDQTSKRSYVRFIKGTSTETEDGYQIPEAFWWDNDGDGKVDEGEQLTGYWISKYQLSLEDSTPRMNVEMSAGSNLIRLHDITGTLIDNATTNGINVSYEYYLNGVNKYVGTSATEHFVFKGLESNKTYTVNVIARNKDTKEYIGAVTKKIKTIAPYAPDISSFNKDVTYYVVYEGDTEKRVSFNDSQPGNWYDYSNRQWANIVTTGIDESGKATETYFVWIPRYEYKIVSDRANLSTANRRIDVSFITTDITNDNCTTGYQVPEAFWWDNDGDGVMDEGEQLKGYWISKYQLNSN